jgi:hypothetical protein
MILFNIGKSSVGGRAFRAALGECAGLHYHEPRRGLTRLKMARGNFRWLSTVLKIAPGRLSAVPDSAAEAAT